MPSAAVGLAQSGLSNVHRAHQEEKPVNFVVFFELSNQSGVLQRHKPGSVSVLGLARKDRFVVLLLAQKLHITFPLQKLETEFSLFILVNLQYFKQQRIVFLLVIINLQRDIGRAPQP